MAKNSVGTSGSYLRIPSPIRVFIETYNSEKVARMELINDKSRAEAYKEYDALRASQGINYSIDQQRGIRAYARNSSALNHGLETGNLTAWQKRQVKRLDGAFTPINRDIILYKGWGGGELRNTSAYTSLSISMLGAQAFGHSNGGYAAFRIPKGTPVIFGERGECEIILPRQFNLKKHRIL